MSWSDFDVNWEAPEYKKAECMEALRQATVEKCKLFCSPAVGSGGLTAEYPFKSINKTLAVDRESGEYSFTPNYYSNDARSVLSSGYYGPLELLSPIQKSVEDGKLSFQRYTQIGHALDLAIMNLIYGGSYYSTKTSFPIVMWIKWWDFSGLEGVSYPPSIGLHNPIDMSYRNVFNHGDWRDLKMISGIEDILDYIGDTELYFFSEYGDNTKWARQKYLILNALKSYYYTPGGLFLIPMGAAPSAMGSFSIARYGTHNYSYYKNTDSANPEGDEETESGDPPFSATLDGSLATGFTRSVTPIRTDNGAFYYQNYSQLNFSASSSETERTWSTMYWHQQSSQGFVSYLDKAKGALVTRATVPLNIDLYAYYITVDYSGHVYAERLENGSIRADYYDHHLPSPNPDGILQWAALESWNPLGLSNVETYRIGLLTSYRLASDTDFQDAIQDIYTIDTNIPSLPSLPNLPYTAGDGTEYIIERYGVFSGDYVWQTLAVVSPEFEFNGD